MRKRMSVIAAFAALTLVGAYALFQQQGLPIGSDAPDFKLTTLDGKTVEMSKLRGKPVFIEFWATWCGFCKRAMPDVQKLAETYGKDAHILTINVQEDASKVGAFMQQHNYTFPVLMDTNGAVARAYRVRGYPTFVLIDANGKVQVVQPGYSPNLAERFGNEIKKAIQSSPSKNDS